LARLLRMAKDDGAVCLADLENVRSNAARL